MASSWAECRPGAHSSDVRAWMSWRLSQMSILTDVCVWDCVSHVVSDSKAVDDFSGLEASLMS